tara:strand:+ start:1545 stop:1829 length:285 start_codon:yes stop_codon:yes gene_type:complete
MHPSQRRTRRRSNKRQQKRQQQRTAKKGGSKKSASKKSASKKSASKKGGSKKGRPVNKFFKLMMDAKKNNLESFEYNNKKYNRQQKGHLTFYKA